MDYRKAIVSETARIAPTACIVGDVELGENVTVLTGSALRGDYGGRVVIGDGSNIQENVCIHVDRGGGTSVGKNVTIGHGAILHGCTIGDGCVVGMGSIILDGARVGKNCLIGAGALVTGTADIPEGMLVIGSPARAKRALSEEEITRINEGAGEYLEIGRSMAAQGLLFQGRESIAANCPQVALA